MSIQENRRLLHWNYFLALESDVERLARFVEFTNENFNTYSIEMAHLFLAAASEVDVISKQLCSLADPASAAQNIHEYRTALRPKFPGIEASIVAVPRYGLELRPWDNWRQDKTPEWWGAYNDVKHRRGENFPLANLYNVLNAMAGLFVLALYYHRDIIEGRSIEPPPILFSPPSDIANVCGMASGGIALFFNQEDR